LCFVGDYEGGLFNGDESAEVGPLGLNVPAVADLLQRLTTPEFPAGAAHLRWGDATKPLRDRFGEEVVVLAFLRQTFHLDSVGGISDAGSELLGYAINGDQASPLSAAERDMLFDLSRSVVIRVRPVESDLFEHAAREEHRLIGELRRPTEAAIRQGKRYAVWPVLAVHLSP
jgi:hypothetical protein